jgi:transcriptional regulator with XRE-family HTH domain
LVSELTKLRTAAGLTEVALAKAVGFSNSKISRMEDSKVPIFIDDLETLLDFYRVSKARRTELLDVARHAQERNWLRINNPNLPHDWQVWEDFELEARALLNFELSMIPGLLQTPEYARTIIAATGRGLSEAEVDGLVASRMSRQNLLTLTRPVRLHAIIDQQALDRSFGNQNVVVQQIQHLIRMIDRPNVGVQLLPTDAGLHSGLNGPFVLMHYAEDASLVLLENKVASMFLDEDEQIETYDAVWGELSALAYDEVESLEYFRALVAKLGG